MISKSISKASRLWTPSGWEQQVGSACGKLLLELLFHRIPLPLREGFSSQLSPCFRKGLRCPEEMLWLLLAENPDSRKHKVLS